MENESVDVSMPVVNPVKRKYISLAVILIICITIFGLIMGLLSVIDNADKVADNYSASLKSYLNQLSDITISKTLSPAQIKESISAINKPQLQSTFLGTTSAKYMSAQTTSVSTDVVLTTFNNRIDGYAAVSNYMTMSNQYVDNLKASTAVTNSPEYFTVRKTGLAKIKDAADSDKIPVEIKNSFTEVSKLYDDAIRGWVAYEIAYNAHDRVATNLANNQIITADNSLESATSTIKVYYDDLPNKFIIISISIRNNRSSSYGQVVNEPATQSETKTQTNTNNIQSNNQIQTKSQTTNQTNTQSSINVSKLTQVTSGTHYSCGIGPDSLAYCWGNGVYGELGNNANTPQSDVPVAVYIDGLLKGKTIKAISAGDHHACVIASDNQAYCWGIGTYGELGNSFQQINNFPTAVYTAGVLNGKTIKTIKSTNRYSCVVASDSLTYCWGFGIFGNDEHGNIKSQLVPALHSAI